MYCDEKFPSETPEHYHQHYQKLLKTVCQFWKGITRNQEDSPEEIHL